MLTSRRALAVLLAALLTAAGAGVARPAQAAPVGITNGTQFTDTAGNPLHAHGGGVLKVGDYYYWFGENRNTDNTFRYVSVYRSSDLKNWEWRNNVLTQASSPQLQTANIERPKVIYNSATGQFVMWMHKENGRDYSEAQAAVATSSTVDGNYVYRGATRPLNHMSRDITLFKDDDGTAYMISAANDNRDLHVYRLTADYLSVSARVQNLWPGSYREAPAMFKRGGVYFLLTSGATGWAPNQQKYATASSVVGSWSGLQNVGDGTAFGSQTAYVLAVQGTQTTSYLYLGDRWAGDGQQVNASKYVWLPLSFPTATTMSMTWSPGLTIDAATGVIVGSGASPQFVAGYSGKCLDVNGGSGADGATVIQWSCGSGGNQRFALDDAGGGYYRLVAQHSGKCLDVADGSRADGAAVIQWSCAAGAYHQQWQLRASGATTQLVARHSGKCLDVADWSSADGAVVDQWTCNGGANQQWTRR
ncbi:RICIN domain-containing protein [Micromonospora sp. DT233]|uniref:RICIN domain-containing protein n=1 Tax=Micromonospora sp. DT233 TaxID=3393432 RepID=UPI003CEAB441